MQCIPAPHTFTPAGPQGVTVPFWVRTAERRVQQLLRGRCLIILGDSVAAEFAWDIAVLLGANYTELSHMQASIGPCDSHSLSHKYDRVSSFEVHLEPCQRSMSIIAPRPVNVTVFSHYIAHQNIFENYQGHTALFDTKLRDAVERKARTACEGRPRVLWMSSPALHSLYKDQQHKLSDPEIVAHEMTQALPIINWLESVAPERIWLSARSQNGSTYKLVKGKKIRQHRYFNTSTLENGWRAQLGSRAGWKVVDTHCAFTCETNSMSIPTHIGFLTPVNNCYRYQSMLRTLSAFAEECHGWRTDLS